MKFQTKPTRDRAPIVLSVALVSAAAALSGCMSSPTYGTGVTANQQLMNDVSGVLALGSGSNRGPEIAYTPRAELVKPSTLAVLPEPQQDMASAQNPAWPESPEQRRARIRAEATANQDNAAYRSQIRPGGFEPSEQVAVRDTSFGDYRQGGSRTGNSLSREEQQKLAQIRRASNQGDPNQRKFLSEPPVDYRQPEASAPTDELGIDERRKEQQIKRASGDGKSWRDFVPWL